jgi:hypothetical protein
MLSLTSLSETNSRLSFLKSFLPPAFPGALFPEPVPVPAAGAAPGVVGLGLVGLLAPGPPGLLASLF